MREIHNVTCVGAGLIGQGWATVFAAKGCTVVMQDLTDAILDRALESIARNLDFLEAHQILKKSEAAIAKCRIQKTSELEEAVAQAEYIQESCPDRYEIKKPVFEALDKAASPEAILASSSSGLLMTEIQKVTRFPERCVMTHPFLPAHLVPVVEVMGGEKTSSDSLDRVCEFLKMMGKVPVLLKKEVSGYIVNRLQAALLREAIDLIHKGVASADDVDKAFCMGMGLRDPMIGPFLRIHLVGNGISDFFENYADSYRLRWESMESWTRLPASAVRAVIESVNEIDKVRTLRLEELKVWRDEMLIKILELVKPRSEE